VFGPWISLNTRGKDLLNYWICVSVVWNRHICEANVMVCIQGAQ